MNKFLIFILSILASNSLFAQSFPILIWELYPYHTDPTTVYWREDQRCIPSKIEQYSFLENGDSMLFYYQRKLSTNGMSITVSYEDPANYLPKKSLTYYYDSLGRMVYFDDFRINPNPPFLPAQYESKRYHYRSNTPWLDSLVLNGPTGQTRQIFQYNQDELLVSIYSYKRSGWPSPWIESGYQNFNYDASKRLIQIEETIPMVLSSVRDISYDSLNRISTIFTTYPLYPLPNPPDEKLSYTYNNVDSTTLQVKYQWINGGWKTDSKSFINLGFMGRLDSLSRGADYPTTIALKYNNGETCPYLALRDDVSGKYKLYFFYPNSVNSENELKEDIDVSVYPNPNNGSFWVEAPIGSELVLQDLMGQIIWRNKSTGDNHIILPNFNKGLFLLSISIENITTVRKVIIL